ncbi:MAG: helix-turn-helix domain-containing protein [Acidiferrobacteraceae bacterium]
MMAHAHKAAPEPQAILRAWMPFKEALGVTSVRTEGDYTQARATIDALIDEIGEDENHPLAEVLGYLADQVKAYEDAHFTVPEAEPREVLRFLMAQHDLKQEDLSDCAPQGRISDILSGKRGISKDIARKLARRFNVGADLFF